MRDVVCDNIRMIREAKGVTKTHLAKGLGMSLQGYRYLESGQVKLDVERMIRIAQLLGVNSAVLLDDEQTRSIINEIQGNK